jgi:hypothetical protein
MTDPEQDTSRTGIWTTEDLEWVRDDLGWSQEKLAKFVDELAQLADEREQRYRQREARILADITLDARLKELYLDRTLWSNADIATYMGVKPQRVNELRGGRAAGRRPRPHPSMLPPNDAVIGYVPGLQEFEAGTEAGAVREWLDQRGSHEVDRETTKAEKVPWRVGRPRADRSTLSKAHVPGTPRKGKKGTAADDAA